LHQVGQALVAFALEVVLGGPQRMVAEVVHYLGDVPGSEEHLRQALVRVPALVGRGAVEADVVEVDLADIEDVKAFDHGGFRTFADLLLHDPKLVWRAATTSATYRVSATTGLTQSVFICVHLWFHH
jgi:hypothetical protein